ncbi:hypothetical protein [Rhizobium rhizogenes]|uniref:hypothetical protein n=1 Tax=Rhizobium rhizogenes TaxID=359 RepID=UPI001571B86B|nr:hypothetical protein [Rhizobium rhizogenes]NTG94212.1 hypothetical protein [Rhizobium rhizogenes]
MSKIVAYACSTRPNALWSAAQFDSAAPKNRTECDIPLVALSDLEAERQRTDSLKAMCDEMAKALEEIRDASPTGSRWTTMSDGTWREACRDLQRIARLSVDAYRKAQEASP